MIGTTVRKSKHGGRVTAVDTHKLTGAFSNAVVAAMAAADGLAGFFTSRWGKDNRATRAINAFNAGVGVSTEIVADRVHRELGKSEKKLESTAPKVPLAEDATLAAAYKSEEDDNGVAEMEERCASEGIGVPDHRLIRLFLWVLGLAVLGGGDEKFCTLCFQVFGLSSRRIARFFPVSELGVVSGSVVAGLLIAVGIAGARLARLWHALEAAPSTDPADNRRRKTRVVAEGSAVIVGVAGALCALFGISGVRADFLAQEGVAAHWGEFFLIQIGVATAGLMLSVWESHPYDREWRSVSHRAKASRKGFRGAQARLVSLVGAYNGLIREREAILGEALAHAHALKNHSGMQAELYAGDLQRALPEPTTDRLFPESLPQPGQQRLIDELDKYFSGAKSIFKKYQPADLKRVENALKQIRQRQENRLKRINDRGVAAAATTDAPSPAKASTNGDGPKRAVTKP